MELSIDTASEMAGLALSEQGQPIAELLWRCQRNHSTEVMPAIERLLQQFRIGGEDLEAVFVCVGPGGYAGLRVGISLAKALAFAWRLPIVGIGRLEVEAYQILVAGAPGPVCAVHQAGRGDVAWAVYETDERGWRAIAPPRLSRREDLPSLAPRGSIFCGEIDAALTESIRGRLGADACIVSGAAAIRRPGFLAEMGWRRLKMGQVDNTATLRPLYLREPAIGPPSRS